MDRGTTVRHPQHWLMTGLFFAALAVICLGIAFKPATPMTGRFAFVLVVVAIVGFGQHAVRAGIDVDETGLTVRGFVGRPQTVAWSEVEGFEFRPYAGGGVYVAALLTDGRQLTTRGLIFKRPSARAAGEAIDTLDAWLTRWGSPGRGGP